MKFLVAISCLVAVAVAKPSGVGHISAPGFAYSSLTAHAPVISAYTAPLAAVGHQSTTYTHGAIAAAPALSAYSAPITVAHHAAPVAFAHNTAYAAPAAISAPVARLTSVASVPTTVSHQSSSITHGAIAAAPAIAAYSAPLAVGHSASIAAPALAAYTAPVAVAHSASIAAPALTAYTAPVAVAHSAPVAAFGIEKSQYHAQDTLGQASYGHTEAFQSHHAIQDIAGNKAGAYSWVAPDGQVIQGRYVADALGYRVQSNAVPVGPATIVETPEVIAARSAHLAAHVAARNVW